MELQSYWLGNFARFNISATVVPSSGPLANLQIYSEPIAPDSSGTIDLLPLLGTDKRLAMLGFMAVDTSESVQNPMPIMYSDEGSVVYLQAHADKRKGMTFGNVIYRPDKISRYKDGI